jgi:hypothetical protein
VNWYLAPVIVDENGYTQVASRGVAYFPPSSRAHIGRASDVPVPTQCLIKTAMPERDWVLVAPEDFDAMFTSLFGRAPLDVEK